MFPTRLAIANSSKVPSSTETWITMTSIGKSSNMYWRALYTIPRRVVASSLPDLRSLILPKVVSGKRMKLTTQRIVAHYANRLFALVVTRVRRVKKPGAIAADVKDLIKDHEVEESVFKPPP